MSDLEAVEASYETKMQLLFGTFWQIVPQVLT